MIKVTPRLLRAFILAMGVLLILLGLSKPIFKVGLPDGTEKTLSSVLFFSAAIACLYLFKLRREEAQNRSGSARDPGADPPGSKR